MIKNQSATIPFFLYVPTSGAGATGATNISVFISKDGGTPVATTNSPTEVSASNAPGTYTIVLTAAEMNANVIVLTFSHASYAAMPLTITTYSVSAIQDGLAQAADLATVDGVVDAIKAKTDALPEHPAAVGSEMALTSAAITAAQSGLATSDALSTVSTNIGAIKAKTDNLPESPAAVGSAMTLTDATIASVKNGLATSDGLSALESHGDTYWITADVSGIATSDGLSALASYGDSHWSTADVADLAKSSEVSAAQTALASMLNLLLSGLYHWQVSGDILTIYNSSNVPIGAYQMTKTNNTITAIMPIVQTETTSDQ